MIKNILIPEQIGSYFVMEKKILYVSVNKFQVTGVLFVYSGNSKKITKIEIKDIYDFSASAIIQAVESIIVNIGKFDELVTSVPSFVTFFKKLTVPFMSIDKLKHVIPFEIESYLPFSMQDAVFDFVVSNKNLENNTITVLVAVTKKEDVDSYLTYFNKANIVVDRVIVVPLLLIHYFIAHEIKKEAVIFIEINVDSINLLYIEHGNILGMRSLSQSLYDELSKADMSSIYTLLHFKNQGFSDKVLKAQEILITQCIKNIKESIVFFQESIDLFKQPQEIIFAGYYGIVNSFLDYIEKELQMKVKVFHSQNDEESMQHFFAPLLYGIQNNKGLNFLSQNSSKQFSLFKKQVIFFTTTFFIGLFSLLWYIYSDLQYTYNEYLVSKKELVTTFEKHLSITFKNKDSIASVMKQAQEEVHKETALWNVFFKQSKESILDYLEDLFLAIDRSAIGLQLQKMVFSNDEIELVGSVKDLEALEIFEQELASLKRLAVVEKPEQLQFSIKLKPVEQ